MLMRTNCKGTNQNGAPRTKGHPPDLLFAKASGAESSQPSRTLADTFAHTNRRFRIPGHFITPAKPPWIDGLDPPGDTRLHVRLHHSVLGLGDPLVSRQHEPRQTASYPSDRPGHTQAIPSIRQASSNLDDVPSPNRLAMNCELPLGDDIFSSVIRNDGRAGLPEHV